MRKVASIVIALGIVLYALYGLSPSNDEGLAELDEQTAGTGGERSAEEQRVVDHCGSLVERIAAMGRDQNAIGAHIRESLTPQETIALCAEFDALTDEQVGAALKERFDL